MPRKKKRKKSKKDEKSVEEKDETLKQRIKQVKQNEKFIEEEIKKFRDNSYEGNDFRVEILSKFETSGLIWLLPEKYRFKSTSTSDEKEREANQEKFLKKTLIELQSFSDVVDVILTPNNILHCKEPRIDKNYYLKKLIKRKWKKKDLKKYLEENFDDVKKAPKLYTKQIDLLVSKLIGVGSDDSKRGLEKEYIKKMEKKMFVSLCGFQIPDDLILVILSYLPKNKKVLDNVGCVNETLYLLVQLSWEKIYVHSENLSKIPVLVLNSCSKIEFITDRIFKENFQYFQSNAKRVKKLTLRGSKRSRYFFTGCKTSMDSVKVLYVDNLFELKINRKFFPNVSELHVNGFKRPPPKKLSMIEEYRRKRAIFSGRKVSSKKKLKLEKDTSEFMKGITSIRFKNEKMNETKVDIVSNLLNYLERKIHLAKYIKELICFIPEGENSKKTWKSVHSFNDSLLENGGCFESFGVQFLFESQDDIDANFGEINTLIKNCNLSNLFLYMVDMSAGDWEDKNFEKIFSPFRKINLNRIQTIEIFYLGDTCKIGSHFERGFENVAKLFQLNALKKVLKKSGFITKRNSVFVASEPEKFEVNQRNPDSYPGFFYCSYQHRVYFVRE